MHRPDATHRGSHDGAATVVVRLRHRREFLRAARGLKWHASTMTVQCVPRPDGCEGDVVGLGFTVTKKLGNAVRRNRARRRLREAARIAFPSAAAAGHDYVVIARPASLTCPFDAIIADMTTSLRGLAGKRAARASR